MNAYRNPPDSSSTHIILGRFQLPTSQGHQGHQAAWYQEPWPNACDSDGRSHPRQWRCSSWVPVEPLIPSIPALGNLHETRKKRDCGRCFGKRIGITKGFNRGVDFLGCHNMSPASKQASGSLETSVIKIWVQLKMMTPAKKERSVPSGELT